MPILRTINSVTVVSGVMLLMWRWHLIRPENIYSAIALGVAIMALLRTYEKPEPIQRKLRSPGAAAQDPSNQPGAARRIA